MKIKCEINMKIGTKSRGFIPLFKVEIFHNYYMKIGFFSLIQE